MTLSFVRTSIAVALVALLAACGGKASFEVRGTVTGLAYPGLKLVNGDQTIEPVPAAGNIGSISDVTFAFPKSIDYGTTYDVKIAEKPLQVGQTVAEKYFPQHQTCELINGTDTAGRLAEINVIVQCVINTFAVGGKVKGLTKEGLVLINGSSGQNPVTPVAPTPPATATPDVVYAFANVRYNTTYGVSIFKQPTGQICSIDSGVMPSGTMGDAAVSNIDITCI
ncbi:hypothetical protein [Massilia glaciei]|uniref:Lipoprotein n=1 Tax=Massilia glaciei TaxID=1524097 RepID=A0A2U2HMP7_9BURK|nr:hypothetical protein [Massilia glaciei]PWF48780.1 hypothetical protein C7C56_009905 [Massilia glaciei]